MALINLKNEKAEKTIFILTLAIATVWAVLYFMPEVSFAFKKSVTLPVLALGGLFLLPWQMFLAMLFSGIGDLMGDLHIFMAQLGFFALAHICMLSYFIRLLKIRKIRLSKLEIMATAVTAGTLCCISFLKIVPHAPAGVVQIGTIVYTCLIVAMFVTAVMHRSPLLTIAAALFVASDMILAINKFVQPLEGQRYLIMVPYYLAQLLFFIRTSSVGQKYAWD